MKRSRPTRPAKQSPDQDEVLRLALGLGQSSCRIEDDFWEQRLLVMIDQLLADKDEETLNAALETLYRDQVRAYEALADLIETRCESRGHLLRAASGDAGGKHWDLLLFCAPLLAWSRYNIPSGSIAPAALENAKVHLQAHVFARDVRLSLADCLFSPDQLPQSYCDTAALCDKLGKNVLQGRDLHIDFSSMPETTSFLSDTRFLVGAVATPHGAPLFRWQEEDGNRNEALAQWNRQGGAVLRPLLPGCACELLLPQPYHGGCRNADRLSRPYSLRASVDYLSTTLNVPASGLRAVVAPCYGQDIEEYRIGFTLRNAAEVVHGVVWPMLDAEDDMNETGTQIETLLRETGIGAVMLLDHRLPLEYCDDCGVPLYPTPDGELVHAELPEEHAEQTPRHLH